jgi:hypothetical protein
VIEVFVTGIGIHGPGISDWATAVPVLAGTQAMSWDALPLPPPALLGPNERRRAGTVVRLALAVAQQASDMAGSPAGAMHSIFASSNGDGAVVHAILETLASTDGQVSPTQFHNSVHNAPAGYWSIGTHSKTPTGSLGCHDASAAAALLKAAAEAHVEREPVLVCIYDVPLPPPLARTRPTEHAFGAALVLMPHACDAPLARLRLEWLAEPASDVECMPNVPQLRTLYRANPAARILALLETIARRDNQRLSLPLLDGRIDITVESCWTEQISLR